MSLRAPASLILIAALWSAAIPAATARPGGEQAEHGSVVTLPLQDLPSGDTVFERIGRMFDGFLGIFSSGQASASPARLGAETLRSQIQQRDDFVALMETAGYGLREIETSIGLIPGSRMTFGQARELTDADRDYIERQLERHAQRQGGPLSRVQRAIVGAVVAASEIGDLSVERVEIDLFPLPQIKMALVPRDAPMSLEAGRLIRSIDRLGEQLQAPRALHGETELQMRRQDPPLRSVGMQVMH
ncbi:hypothetical protein [Neoroseomonas lacus]|uniref:Uncharacterized protein n=1 Tax=Neoroseomonas lacus TaxID=287609 RepID=A0A917K3T3_9PROT|nr:hypothetical protein [Neoroseomonas lacus]GGI98996.1 hypothetical protein GCM10011320_02210 [Neoroseomonas lacus]